MIVEYYDDWNSSLSYTPVGKGVVTKFEDYLSQNSISLDEAYENVAPFTDTLSIQKKTRSFYRTQLRRLLEHIHEEEGIKW